jgi:tetratricopeptide (TPR) repeat protein
VARHRKYREAVRVPPLCHSCHPVTREGTAVSDALLVRFYGQLLTAKGGTDAEESNLLRQAALEEFRQRVAARYTEGTLLRLLASPEPRTRRAAVLALGLVGTMAANAPLAARLRDDDPETGRMAGDSLWSLWLRGDTPDNGDELRRLTRLRDGEKALAGLDELIRRAPRFAEAYNQRAVVLFRLGRYEQSITDCQRTLKLNPFHFGAQAGIGQCFLKLHKDRAALKALRAALRMNPHLDGIADTVRTLEIALGEEGRRDDKK